MGFGTCRGRGGVPKPIPCRYQETTVYVWDTYLKFFKKEETSTMFTIHVTLSTQNDLKKSKSDHVTSLHTGRGEEHSRQGKSKFKGSGICLRRRMS